MRERFKHTSAILIGIGKRDLVVSPDPFLVMRVGIFRRSFRSNSKVLVELKAKLFESDKSGPVWGVQWGCIKRSFFAILVGYLKLKEANSARIISPLPGHQKLLSRFFVSTDVTLIEKKKASRKYQRSCWEGYGVVETYKCNCKGNGKGHVRIYLLEKWERCMWVWCDTGGTAGYLAERGLSGSGFFWRRQTWESLLFWVDIVKQVLWDCVSYDLKRNDESNVDLTVTSISSLEVLVATFVSTLWSDAWCPLTVVRRFTIKALSNNTTSSRAT